MPLSLNRREFLRDLGLLGAVSLTPVLEPGLIKPEQLDESWKPGPSLRPAWVKTVDKPTTEVDWTQVKRIDERNTTRTGFAKYVTPEEFQRLTKLQSDNLAKFLKANTPGYTLKDASLKAATNAGRLPLSFLGPTDKDGLVTPEKNGVPKWTGSPEDALQMITAAFRHLGVSQVGVVELDPNTTQKLIYSIDTDGHEIVFQDVDQPQETDKQRIIPNKARYAIVWSLQMSAETLKRAPVTLGAQTTTLTYTRYQQIQWQMQMFLKSLGYMALGEASLNGLGISPALGAMAGLGEMSRTQRLLSPEYGLMMREYKMITDLPLAPTKPINAGILEFCKACKVCAEACPSGALSMDTEPTWQVKGAWNNPGHKAWFEDSVKCRYYWYETGNNCGICFSVCPFSAQDKSVVHEIAYNMISGMPIANPIMKSLHDLTYGPADKSGKPLKDPEAWWKLDLPEYGIDSARGHRVV